MALSKKRIIFRRFLYVTLIFSLVFAGTMGYYRMTYKKTRTLAPIFFKADAAKYQVLAMFSDDHGKYKIARKLYAFTSYSEEYYQPGVKILDELIAKNNPEALVFRAHHMIRHPDPKIKARAIDLYERAARQHHNQAVLALYKIHGE